MTASWKITQLTILCFFLLCSNSWSKDSIAWMEAVAPPFFIHEGEFKGQGYEDLITDILIEQLPQYEHSHLKANISRHYQQWKQGERACGLAMFKTPERMEFAYFSIPSVFTLPTVLIIKKDNFQKFGGKSLINLEELLKNNSIIIGRSNNRSFGIEFDDVLNKYENETNTFRYEGPELSLNLFKMLLAGRIDALGGLPEEAMYISEKLGFRDKIMTISIEENQRNHNASLTYVACSKNEWGKKTIADINKVLITQRPTERYRAAYERWLDPSSFERFRTLYRDAFLTVEK